MERRREEILRHIMARLWTPDLIRAVEELRARHPEASFEVAGIEIALVRAIESVAGELTPTVGAAQPEAWSLGSG
jgi:hypothetical protein